MVRRIAYMGDGAQGVRLISRIIYDIAGTYTPTVPEGATWCVARGVGAGGVKESGATNDGAGGSGAYARAGFEINFGDTISAVVPAANTTINTNGSDATVSRNGVEKVKAKGGNKGVGTTGGTGGQAASCTGDVKRSGGNGGSGGGTLAAAEGTQGTSGPPKATGHSAAIPTAGSPASDIGDVDALGMAGPALGGATDQNATRGAGWGGHGGTGATSNNYIYGMPGRVAVEFYTGNPYP